MKNWFLTLAFILAVAASATAQTVYTLDSCKAIAVRGNLTLQNKKLAVESAKELKKEAYTKYFPNVTARGVGFWSTDYLINADFDLGTFQTSFFSPVSISIDLPSIPVKMIRGGVIGNVMAVQPIFAGLRIVRGNQLAQLGVKAAELQAQMSEDEVCQQVEYYYWQIVALQKKLELLDTLDRQLTRIGHDVDAAVAAGVTTSNNQLQVKLKQQELASGKIRVLNGIKTYKAILRQTAQLPTADFDIADENLDMPAEPENLFVETQQGILQRTESQLLDMQVQAAELQTQMKIGEYLPQAVVGAGYNVPYFKVNDDNTSFNHFGLVFGMVTVPISDWWGGSHAIRQCRINEQIARNERDNNLQLMSVQIQQSWNEVSEAYQQLQIAQKSIELANENLRMQQDFFHAGTTTLTDLLNAQSMLQQSADSYTEAFVDFQVKKQAYLQNTGRNQLKIK